MVRLGALLSVEVMPMHKSTHKTKYLMFLFGIGMSCLETKLFPHAVCPNGPVADTVLTKILVDDSSHPVRVEWLFECHSVNLSRSKPFEISTYLAGKLIPCGEARLEGIVMGDKNFPTVQLPSVNFENAIFEHVGIVVEIIRRKLSRNLDELRRDLRAPRACQFGVDLFSASLLTGEEGTQPYYGDKDPNPARRRIICHPAPLLAPTSNGAPTPQAGPAPGPRWNGK